MPIPADKAVHVFSMGGNQFYSLGSYDQGMDVWGGENVEMSMRLWTCAASIRMLPYRAFGPPTFRCLLTTFPCI